MSAAHGVTGSLLGQWIEEIGHSRLPWGHSLEEIRKNPGLGEQDSGI